MSDGTNIEWARHPVTGRGATWNPITGCTLESEGCRNCYAARLAATRLKHHPSREGLARLNAEGVAKFTGAVRFNAEWLDQPLRWRTPRGVFVCAHGDLFAPGVPDEWIDQVFAVMALAPQHVFFVLTKRPARARAYLLSSDRRKEAAAQAHCMHATGRWAIRQDVSLLWPLPNVWLGTSVEDQATADARIPELLATPAARRFVSAEPLLGPVDLMACPSDDALLGYAPDANGDRHRLDWVIVGGESGPHARPMHPDWVRNLRDQCAAAAVPFFFKQWGEWAPGEAIKRSPTRTEQGATYFDSTWTNPGWSFETVTVRQSQEMHRDDEPDLWRCGKKAAEPFLDGRTHDAMPEAA